MEQIVVVVPVTGVLQLWLEKKMYQQSLAPNVLDRNTSSQGIAGKGMSNWMYPAPWRGRSEKSLQGEVRLVCLVMPVAL